MWLRLAVGDREEVIEMAGKLRRVGARIEIKDWIDWDLEEKFILRGRLSELKNKGIELREWERRIEIIKDIIKERKSYEEFKTEFLRKAYPELLIFAERAETEPLAVIENAKSIIKLNTVLYELETFVKVNGLKTNGVVEGILPEDPEIVIETLKEVEGGKSVINLNFYPVTELYVDVMSLIDVDFDSFEGEHYEFILIALLEVISNILSATERAENVDEIKHYCCGNLREEKWELLVDCKDVFDHILKSLEKAGLVRISGKKIKLRRK
ncbi:MAG: hypothetical protein QXN34_04685 [Archaeoglobaceae archaeon]